MHMGASQKSATCSPDTRRPTGSARVRAQVHAAGRQRVVELSPFEFFDRLLDLVPPPRKHRHRYHGVFAPNHTLRPAVTTLAIGNSGKLCDAATGGRAVGGHAARGDATGACCDSCDQPRSHDTSRIAEGQTHGPGG